MPQQCRSSVATQDKYREATPEDVSRAMRYVLRRRYAEYLYDTYRAEDSVTDWMLACRILTRWSLRFFGSRDVSMAAIGALMGAHDSNDAASIAEGEVHPNCYYAMQLEAITEGCRADYKPGLFYRH